MGAVVDTNKMVTRIVEGINRTEEEAGSREVVAAKHMEVDIKNGRVAAAEIIHGKETLETTTHGEVEVVEVIGTRAVATTTGIVAVGIKEEEITIGTKAKKMVE